MSHKTISFAVLAIIRACNPTPSGAPSAQGAVTPQPDPSVKISPAARLPAAPSSRPPSVATRYSLGDLEALEAREAWEELVEHLEDVAPSERDPKWTTLVARAVFAHLQDKRRQTDMSPMVLAKRADDFLLRYPSLRESPDLLDLHADLGVAAVEVCAGDSWRWAECSPLVAHMERSGRPVKTLTAARAALSRGHRVLAMALARLASEKDAREVCGDKALFALAVSGRSTPKGTPIKRDAEVVMTRCKKVH
ncbi:MAG: hypothetical protein KC657_23220 [Myxococcales bacterium]|nr:hypothetical protein [Myxococcales bacterium]